MSVFGILSLLNIPKCGKATARNLLKNLGCPDPNNLYEYLIQAQHQGISKIVPDKTLIDISKEKSLKILDSMNKNGIKAVTSEDELFPSQLKEDIDEPVILYYKGDISILNQACVAVIGTRKPTPYGFNIAKRFGQVFAEKGLTVVSGLALGCDTGGHEGCIEVNGKTCAVMANGLNEVYPAKNKKLAADILDAGGCLISEYHPESKLMSGYFVERDKIQSSLSMGIVVVESDIDGGTMHTVKFAINKNRLIGCFQHDSSYDSFPQVSGNRKLIHESIATPLRTKEDITEFTNELIEAWKKIKDSKTLYDVNREQTSLKW